MLRLAMMAAALLLSVNEALAHGDEPAAAPKKELPPVFPAKVAQTKQGPILVDNKGMTLYTFDRDTGSKSACEAKCTERWTPLAAPADAPPKGDFTVVTRSDGSRMWAYRFRPLYTSASDKAPGDANGFDGANLWHIARPTF
jgi:predicted lipoprotein with Yx(FWY)xxD motif